MDEVFSLLLHFGSTLMVPKQRSPTGGLRYRFDERRKGRWGHKPNRKETSRHQAFLLFDLLVAFQSRPSLLFPSSAFHDVATTHSFSLYIRPQLRLLSSAEVEELFGGLRRSDMNERFRLLAPFYRPSGRFARSSLVERRGERRGGDDMYISLLTELEHNIHRTNSLYSL